ncbi:MAG: VOC family protein [Ilumatobacteraceae bacterium]
MTLFPDKDVAYSSVEKYPELWFDHVAYCVADPRDAFGVLRRDLGVEWRLWEMNGDFGGVQVEFPSAFKVELIHPNSTNRDHFTNRFLERRGPGPHHLTFRTKDLRALLQRADGLDIGVIQMSLDNPEWMEAFIHPRTTGGILVQIAQCPFEKASAEEPDWKTQTPRRRAGFARVDFGSDDPAASRRVFGDLLGGEVEHGPDGSVEFRWNGDRRIRVVTTPTPYVTLMVDCPMETTEREEFVRLLGGRVETEG